MPDAMLTKIASEALESMSGVIDAILGPKLQRIRNWAEKQDLNSRLGSGKIDVLLDKYIKQLLHRICGVTTIVFPQRSLPLTSIYEPLILRERYASGLPTAGPPFAVEDLKEGANYFIVDSAGMGKSTFAKHLVLEVLNYTTKIPLFLELRRVDANETLLGKLAAEMDKTGRDIDERLLHLLFDESDFVLILDGYDEVPEQARNSLGAQITQLAVQCENLQLIVTARPEVSLPELPNSKLLTIDPLTRRQAESLVLRYDEVAKIDVGKRLATQFATVSRQFLKTPLLVVLLYKTYGVTQSIATKITSFYDDVFNALYKGHDLSKAGFAREKDSRLDPEDFRRLLRGFSFLLAARQKDNLKSKTEGVAIVDEAVRLTSIKPASATAFFDDLLLAVPLLVNEGTEYRFIHKSIGEFFAAEFLSYHANPGQIIKHIQDGNLNNAFLNSFQYLSELNPSAFRRFVVAPIAKSILGIPIKNHYIRTMHFLSPSAVGLWPADGYDPFGQTEGGRHIDHPGGLNCSSWTDVKFKGSPYFIGIAFLSRYKKLPRAALEALTEKVENESSSEIDASVLENVIEFEQWITTDDERILCVAEHPALTRVLILGNEFAVKQMLGGGMFNDDDYVEEYDGDDDEDDDEDEVVASDFVTIVTVAACENLLSQIKQEDETQGWLEALVAGRIKPDITS